MLCIVRTDGYFKRVNPAFTNALGYSEEELYARPYIEFVHPDDLEATLRKADDLAVGVSTARFENRYRCKDGSYKWLGWTASASAFVDGLAYTVARDITAQKATEAAREQLILELQASLDQIRTLEGLLPICAYCHRIRDTAGLWDRVEAYISKRTDAEFTHGVCPDCLEMNFPATV